MPTKRCQLSIKPEALKAKVPNAIEIEALASWAVEALSRGDRAAYEKAIGLANAQLGKFTRGYFAGYVAARTV